MLQSVNRHLYSISPVGAVNILQLSELEGVLSVFIWEQTEKKYGPVGGRGGVRTGLQIKQAATQFFLRTGYLKGNEDAGSL